MPSFTLPLHLVSPLNGSHGHWSATAKRRRSERQGACFMARAHVRPLGEMDRIRVRLVRVAPRELDDDNLRGAAKSVRDGIADALGLKSDRDPRVEWVYAQAKGKPSVVLVEID